MEHANHDAYGRVRIRQAEHKMKAAEEGLQNCYLLVELCSMALGGSYDELEFCREARGPARGPHLARAQANLECAQSRLQQLNDSRQFLSAQARQVQDIVEQIQWQCGPVMLKDLSDQLYQITFRNQELLEKLKKLPEEIAKRGLQGSIDRLAAVLDPRLLLADPAQP